MTRMEDHRFEDPLPREWLPGPVPAEGAGEWEALARRIGTAASPSLGRLSGGEVTAAPTPDDLRPGVAGSDDAWLAQLAAWWKPAAAFAAAAAIVLLITDRMLPVDDASHGSLPLALMAAHGDPAVLLRGMGVDADPVLALIALQSRGQR